MIIFSGSKKSAANKREVSDPMNKKIVAQISRIAMRIAPRSCNIPRCICDPHSDLQASPSHGWVKERKHRVLGARSAVWPCRRRPSAAAEGYRAQYAWHTDFVRLGGLTLPFISDDRMSLCGMCAQRLRDMN
jgi:hypothetical protein